MIDRLRSEGIGLAPTEWTQEEGGSRLTLDWFDDTSMDEIPEVRVDGKPMPADKIRPLSHPEQRVLHLIIPIRFRPLVEIQVRKVPDGGNVIVDLRFESDRDH